MTMEILALLSSREEIISAVRNCVSGHTVYPARDLAGAEELLVRVPSALLILDGYSIKPAQVEDILSMYRHPVILLTDKAYNLNKLSTVPETVDIGDICTALPKAVERAAEKRRLEQEIAVLSRDREERDSRTAYDSPRIVEAPAKRLMREQVLLNFAKTLTVNFDLKKLLDHFMDSVMEIIRTNKMSILLREKNIYRIRAQRGMDPYLAESVKLSHESSLIKWLSGHGRILSRSPDLQDRIYPHILREMELLQSAISFPMIYKGKLAGVFNIDSKVTGDPFYKEELEVVFMLCSYLSAAIKDIDSYHKIQYQKGFTKNILSNMNSGVITINADEHISIFNQRAAEILKLEPMDMLGSDLRRLPSPLGDILYETMAEGRSYIRHEIAIKPGDIPLGINSYRLLDENRQALGAVIVFTDLSDLKRLEEEKRKAERLEAVNNLIGKIAHEIKNPLTSIQTFTQLLEEKYTDAEFREFFTLTVSQSVQQLDNLVDKLVLFSSPLDLRPMEYPVDGIIAEAEALASKDMPQGVRLIRKVSDEDLLVKVDRNLFVKALYYLILASADRSQKGDFVLLQAGRPSNRAEGVEISLKFSGSPLTDEEKEILLRPLLDMDAFGIELNVPISQKIIDEHNGTLTLTGGSEGNALIITLASPGHSNAAIKDKAHEW